MLSFLIASATRLLCVCWIWQCWFRCDVLMTTVNNVILFVSSRRRHGILIYSWYLHDGILNIKLFMISSWVCLILFCIDGIAQILRIIRLWRECLSLLSCNSFYCCIHLPLDQRRSNSFVLKCSLLWAITCLGLYSIDWVSSICICMCCLLTHCMIPLEDLSKLECPFDILIVICRYGGEHERPTGHVSR